ncbi:MAG: dihydropteroate synthase [Pseudomonadota bacterium]
MSEIPKLMGVINVTPDSFSDGGQFLDASAAIDHGLKLIDDGADILDIGGESTRPGAELVPEDEEIRRVLPIIEALAQRTPTTLSIDTRKPVVARAAIGAGARIWNDVSALTFAPDSMATAADLDCDIVLMHAQGDPRTMQNDPHYKDVVEDVLTFLTQRISSCMAAGVEEGRLIIDPGIGFGKTREHNLALLRNLERFSELGAPVLLGASRKRFIAAVDRDGPADERLGGSIAAALAGHRQGVSIVRVHDVAETRQALAVAGAIN